MWSTWGVDQAFPFENDIIPSTFAYHESLYLQTVPYMSTRVHASGRLCTPPAELTPLRLLPAVSILGPPF